MQFINLSGTGTLQTTTISFPIAASYAYGQSTQLTSTSNDITAPITFALVHGPATVTAAGLVTITGEGQVTIQASQAAATGFFATSKTATFAAIQATSSVTLVGSIVAGPGNTATLTATIVPQFTGTPSGTVTFFYGAVALQTVPLTGLSATYTTQTFVGPQSFTAVYSGDTNYAKSPASNPVVLNFAVAPTIAFTAPVSLAYGQSFQLAATSNSTGPLAYSLVSGPATVTSTGVVTVGGEGNVVLQVSEAAASGFTAGTKQASLLATQATSTSILTAAIVKSGNGSAALLSASISPQSNGLPTGSVTFYDGTTKLVTAVLVSGKVSYTTPQLVGAQHSFSAVYSGDANFIASASIVVPVTIATSSVSLKLASTSLVYPLPPAFEVFVSPVKGKPMPTGTVTLYDGSIAVGSYPLFAITQGYLLGVVIPPLSVGTHPLVAFYSGDANYASGQSSAVVVTVTPGPVKLSILCSNARVKLGQKLNLTVSVNEGLIPAAGIVSYAYTGGSGALNLDKSGHASISIVPQSKGNFTLTVSYAAQGNFQAAKPESISFTVD